MFETARFEGERRLTGSVVVALGLSAFAAMMVLIAPAILDEFDVAALTESFPPALVEAMRLDVIATIEGFMALELYWFGWLLVLGIYVAYNAASAIAGDIDDGTMDTLLAAPVSRWQVLFEKYLSLLVPILVLNVVVPVALYAGSVLVDMPISPTDLVALHALSVPYLLCWGAVGLLVGVVVRRGRTAGRVALGVVIATWLVESVVVSTEFEWLGAVAPMRYFDPSAVLVDGTYDLVGAGLLLVVAVVLLAASQQLFRRNDL